MNTSITGSWILTFSCGRVPPIRMKSRCWSISSTPGRCAPKRSLGSRNLFLAADYVRTYTDLATMEAANEAARRAVNGILKASGVRCRALRALEAARTGNLRTLARARSRALPAGPSLGRHTRHLGLAALNLGPGNGVCHGTGRPTARSDLLERWRWIVRGDQAALYPLTGGALARQLQRARATMMALIQTAMQLAALRERGRRRPQRED